MEPEFAEAVFELKCHRASPAGAEDVGTIDETETPIEAREGEAVAEKVVVVVVGLPLIDRCLEVDPDLFRLVEGDLDLDQDRIESIESGL